MVVIVRQRAVNLPEAQVRVLPLDLLRVPVVGQPIQNDLDHLGPRFMAEQVRTHRYATIEFLVDRAEAGGFGGGEMVARAISERLQKVRGLGIFAPGRPTHSLTATVPGSSNPYLAGMPNGSSVTLTGYTDTAPAESPPPVNGLLLGAGHAAVIEKQESHY